MDNKSSHNLDKEKNGHDEKNSSKEKILDPKEDIDSSKKVLKCSLCTENGENIIASCFCKTCEIPEPLCDLCGRYHVRQKNMRNHSLSTDKKTLDMLVENKTANCEICLLDGEQRLASAFCQSCTEPEALCEGCASQHIRQRTLRNHQICHDISKLPKKKQFLCEPCIIEGNEIPAESFCKDCDEPEPLCKECARQHLKQRQFRGHLLSNELSQIPLENEESFTVKCAVCLEENIDSKAICFCQDCDEKEPLCPECARQHKRQKIFRGHTLCKDLNLLQNYGKEYVFCDHCKTDDKEVPAEAYCEDCLDPEPLCTTCAGHHVKQKQFRNHKVCRDIFCGLNITKQML